MVVVQYAENQGIQICVPKAHTEPTMDLASIGQPSKTTILNESVLSEVWADMAKTMVPSWISRAPRNLGSASHGKLKADQWRTACCINLVVTLVRLWGQSGSTQQQKDLLDNFLALVTAVRWATMRSTSEERVKIVEDHLQHYLTTLVLLFSEDNLVPNHHFSLHLVECIRAFGPVHGWWSFPFERYNGILQSQNTNNRLGKHISCIYYNPFINKDIPGELELTFLKSFCRGGNLKALLSRDELSDTLQEIQTTFRQHFGSEFRGTLMNDLLALGALETATETATWDPKRREESLSASDPLYCLLLDRINQDATPLMFHSYDNFSPLGYALDPAIQSHDKLKAKGVIFATAKYSRANSLILFRSAVDRHARAGEVQQILVHAHPGPNGDIRTEYFLAVKPFQELTQDEATFDPYRCFPLLDTKLYHDKLSSSTFVIKICDIISHFASCPYTSPILKGSFRVVLSLDRVCALLSQPQFIVHTNP